MKINGLRFRGIGRFHDEVSLPIAELGDAELVAVVGENGAGKTTALETIPGALFRTTPSRGSLAALAGGKDSFVELEVETDAAYKLRIMMDGLSKPPKTEAYAFRADGSPIVSGKAREYDAFIEAHFPAQDVLLSSAFAAQSGEGRFLDLAPAARKGLFARLLGLGRLEALAEAAGQHVRAVETDLAGLRGRIAELEARASRGEHVQAELDGARLAHGEALWARQAAEKRATEVRAEIEAWRARATELDRERATATFALRQAQDSREAASRALSDAQQQLARVGARRAALEDKLGPKAGLEVAVKAGADASAELSTVEAEIAAQREAAEAEKVAAAEWAANKTMFEGKVAAAQERVDSVRREVREAEERLAKVGARRAALEDKLGRRSYFEAIAAGGKDAEAEADRVEADITTARTESEAGEHAAAEWRRIDATLRARLDSAERAVLQGREQKRLALESAQAELLAAEGQAKRLVSVPCGGDGQLSTCPLIASAAAARDSLGRLQAKVEAAHQAMSSWDDSAEVAGIRAEIDALGAQPVVADLKRAIVALEQKWCDLRSKARAAADARAQLVAIAEVSAQAGQADAEAAESRQAIAAMRAALAPLFDAVDERKAELAHIGPCTCSDERADTIAYLVDREESLTALVAAGADAAKQLAVLAEVEAQAEQVDAEAAELRGQVTDRALDVGDADDAVKAAGGALAKAQEVVAAHDRTRPAEVDEAQMAALRQAETSSAAAVARLEADLSAAEQSGRDAAEVRAQVTAETADLDDWKHLQTALGKSGIQALEIDAAGPEVSELTNELLHACYGPRFSVSLETTQLKADGKGTKEVFDLRVIDSERGTEGSADQLSGGEKVLVSEALALAIAIYNTRRSSMPLLTLFRDECSGALSSGNALRYIEMLRRAIQLGGFHRCWFVAHQESLWSMADARIVFEDGTCRVADEVGAPALEDSKEEAA